METWDLPESSLPSRVEPLSARNRAACILLAVGAVLVAGTIVRLWGLAEKSLWFDETYSVFVARQPLVEIPRLLRNYDTHPPLYYVLLHSWITLFGSGEAAVRIPSVLASLGTVLLTFFLGRRLAGNRVGILAAGLLAVSPFQVMSAQEARMYPFLTLFTAGASYALWLALEEAAWRRWAAYAIFMALALYTHYFAALLVLAQAAYVAGFELSRENRRQWVLWVGGAAVLYLPNIPLLVPQILTARGWPDIRPPFSLAALTDLLGMLSFGGGLFGMGSYFKRGALSLEYRLPLLLPFLLLAAAGVAGLGDRRRKAYVLLYLLIPVAAVSLVSLRWNIFYERYFSFVLPPYAILLASGIVYVAQGLRSPRRVAVAAGLVAVVGAYQAAGLTALARSPSAYDWRSLARYVASRADARDFILYIPAFARIPFEYYYRGPQARASLNPREVFVSGGDVKFQAKVDAVRMAGVARDHPRMWIVATVPIGYEARKQIARVLAPYFREVDGRSFGLVYAFLWESKAWQSGRSR